MLQPFLLCRFPYRKKHHIKQKRDREGNRRAKNKVVIISLPTTTFFQQPAMFLLHGNPTLPSQSLWLINVNHPLKKTVRGERGPANRPKNHSF